MNKKRIAVLIDWYLPGNKAGGPVRSVYSFVSLLKHDYDFYIITTNCDLGGEPYKDVQPDTWIKHEGVPVFYFSREHLNKASLHKALQEAKPDLVYLNSFWSYFFSILPLRLKKEQKLSAGILLAPRGMLGTGALSIKPLKKRLFLAFSKLSGLHKGIVFHATTSEEEKDIRRFFRNAKVKTATNVSAPLPAAQRTITKQAGELKLFYLSRIAKVKNLQFALEILADLKTEGVIVYDIYGSIEDKGYWAECENTIRRMPANIRVNYKGGLSFEAVQNTIVQYHYLFLPTLNENYGHSIVESLLNGCPVIISDQTPWNGINQHHCGAALPLTDKEGFRNEIRKGVVIEAAAYSEISENCITFIQAGTDPEQNKAVYKTLFS